MPHELRFGRPLGCAAFCGRLSRRLAGVDRAAILVCFQLQFERGEVAVLAKIHRMGATSSITALLRSPPWALRLSDPHPIFDHGATTRTKASQALRRTPANSMENRLLAPHTLGRPPRPHRYTSRIRFHDPNSGHIGRSTYRFLDVSTHCLTVDHVHARQSRSTICPNTSDHCRLVGQSTSRRCEGQRPTPHLGFRTWRQGYRARGSFVQYDRPDGFGRNVGAYQRSFASTGFCY